MLSVGNSRENVALGVFCEHTERRHGFVASRRLSLHQTGDPNLDSLMIEQNGLLVDRTHTAEISRNVMPWLEEHLPGTDEFHFGGYYRDSEDKNLSDVGALRCAIVDERNGSYVDLKAVRESKKPYLDHLSGNTRQQIRRSMRWYEESGEGLTFNVADTLETALRYYSNLKKLHQEYWQSKGEPGAFSNVFLDVFHDALIRSRFADGEIELAHIACGQRTVGYLYNFVYQGCVANYQSGFLYEDDPKCKPGLVAHTLAIENALQTGRQRYDFLAGDERYKQSLGTHAGRFTWHVLQRPRLKFRLENALRSAKHILQRR